MQAAYFSLKNTPLMYKINLCMPKNRGIMPSEGVLLCTMK